MQTPGNMRNFLKLRIKTQKRRKHISRTVMVCPFVLWTNKYKLGSIVKKKIGLSFFYLYKILKSLGQIKVEKIVQVFVLIHLTEAAISGVL